MIIDADDRLCLFLVKKAVSIRQTPPANPQSPEKDRHNSAVIRVFLRGGSSRGRLRVASRVSDRLPLRGRFFAGAREGLTRGGALPCNGRPDRYRSAHYVA